MRRIPFLTVCGLMHLHSALAAPRFDNAEFTIYYDIIQDCNSETADAQGANKLNYNPNACGYSADALGSSRAVAINENMFKPELCGTEITIYRMDNGQPVHFSDGPLFVGDICPDCQQDHIDLGSGAANDMNGSPGCKNPTGFAWELGERIIGPPEVTSGSSLDAWKASQGQNQGQNQNSPSSSSSASSSSSSSSPSTSSWSSAPVTSWSYDSASTTTSLSSIIIASSSSRSSQNWQPSSLSTKTSHISSHATSTMKSELHTASLSTAAKAASSSSTASQPPLVGGGKMAPLTSNLQVANSKKAKIGDPAPFKKNKNVSLSLKWKCNQRGWS
ncbi:uncharacterized protein I206_103763 [Kwoniella pini CBS 10737]|uniref:Uncharacterized protein n=1 Tax=Kwoniella pini CBS 10737 TaxID=1296096 RepID=A0A1B9HSH9_9TREE|nr:uncharacterized protein I206_07712 [Kwoniella pini CBS 10737]OCF46235.1 hypothetical protein I206_07712 [Kwoniella pini CBS 10737]